MAGEKRKRRVEELIKEEMAALLQERVSDPRLVGISLTDASISADLRICHIYVSLLGDEEARKAALTALEGAKGFLRRELGARLTLRLVPDLIFHLDESLERGARIEALLQKIGAEKK